MEEDMEEDEDKAVPVDRGWAWVICVSLLLEQTIILGFYRVASVMFVDIVDLFQQPSSVVSMMYTLNNITSCISSIISSKAVMARYSVRTISTVAALLNALTTISMALSPNVEVWLFLNALKGVWYGTLLIVPLSLIGVYFKKHQGVANAIASCGHCVAHIAFPLLGNYLRLEFGLPGTVALVGAIEMHVVAVSMLFRSAGSYRKIYSNKLRKQGLAMTTDALIHKPSLIDGSQDKLNLTKDGHAHNGQSGCASEETSYSLHLNGVSFDAEGVPQADEASRCLHSRLSSQQGDTADTAIPYMDSEPSPPMDKFKWKLSSFIDLKFFKNVEFRVLMIHFGLSTFANFVIIYMPAAGFKAGLSKSEAAVLPSIAGAMDLVSRIILGFLVDKGWLSKTTAITWSLFLLSVLCQFARFYTSFPLFVLFSMLAGVLCGVRQNMIYVILLDILGVEDAPKGIAISAVICTVVLSANHPILGVLMDTTGSFIVPFHFVGAVLFTSAVLSCCAPLVVRRTEYRKRKWKEAEVTLELSKPDVKANHA